MTDHGTSPRRGRRARPRPVRRAPALAGSVRIASPSVRRRGRGQSLVEFALVFPLFILLVMAVIEFAFAFNANLAIAFASRDAALVGAEAGDSLGSDLVIIQSVMNDVGASADRNQVTSIEIYWADQNGNYKSGNSSLSNLWVYGSSHLVHVSRPHDDHGPLHPVHQRLSRGLPLQHRRRLPPRSYPVGRHDRHPGGLPLHLGRR